MSNTRPKVVSVMQARLGSTRLPGKMMKDMGGKPLLCRSLDRIHECKEIDEVVVATSDLDRDDAIAELCQSLGVSFFRGDETNVLQRITNAGKSAEAEVIQRVCGEDPLLDPTSIDAGIRIHLENKYDLTTNVRLGDYPDDWPYIDGFDVEVVNAASLQLLCDADLTERYKEHVTLYIRENPQEFSVHEIEPDPSFRLVPPRSFSVDTPEDLEFLRRVYQTFSGVGFIDSREVVDRVRQGALN